jgi:hypothetical protein
MSRWDSRIVPASARHAGRAAVGAGVMVSWARAVMVIPGLSPLSQQPRMPRVVTYIRDVMIVPRGRGPGRRRRYP